jgi:hypothetical protein
MIDRAKFGEAIARVMDRIDRLQEAGEITEEYDLEEVLVVAAFKRPFHRSAVEPDAVEIFVLVDGTTQIPYVQDGLLDFAKQSNRGVWESESD